jgi:hypothetical protein
MKKRLGRKKLKKGIKTTQKQSEKYTQKWGREKNARGEGLHRIPTGMKFGGCILSILVI